jgi:hypothetical protein
MERYQNPEMEVVEIVGGGNIVTDTAICSVCGKSYTTSYGHETGPMADYFGEYEDGCLLSCTADH